MAKWQNGKMAKWQNGKMAKWQTLRFSCIPKGIYRGNNLSEGKCPPPPSGIGLRTDTETVHQRPRIGLFRNVHSEYRDRPSKL